MAEDRARARMLEASDRLAAWKEQHDYYHVIYGDTGDGDSPWTAEQAAELRGLEEEFVAAVDDHERVTRQADPARPPAVPRSRSLTGAGGAPPGDRESAQPPGPPPIAGPG